MIIFSSQIKNRMLLILLISLRSVRKRMGLRLIKKKEIQILGLMTQMLRVRNILFGLENKLSKNY